MNMEPEIIELKTVGNTPAISLSTNDPSNTKTIVPDKRPSVNFGGGLELLMNERRKSDGSKTPTKDVGLEDLNDLENQLNSLSDDIENEKTRSKSGMFNKILDGEIKLNLNTDEKIYHLQ